MATPERPVSGAVEEAPPTGDLRAVRVAIRQLDYHTRGVNPLGQEVDVIKTAYGPGMPMIDPARMTLEPGSQEYENAVSDYQHGQLILLRPQAYMGLIASGAVRDVEYDDAGDEVEVEEVLLDVGTASIDDLAEWIRTERPTVNDVVQASNGEPDIARKLLEAEARAQDGESRQGVLQGLSAVIQRGGD